MTKLEKQIMYLLIFVVILKCEIPYGVKALIKKICMLF